MAPLTWRNVDAPDLSKASQILNQSATMLGGATEGLGENLFDIRNRQRRDRSAAVLPEFAKVANEQGVAGALAKMGSMINPNDMTPELQEAMLNLRGNTLDYENSRATTALNTGNNNRAQANHDLSMRQHADLSRLTGAAVRAREDATGMYGNGGGASAASSGAGGPLNDREILARTIMAEAGGEGYNGMLGVGAVIANRTRAGRYGNNVRDVIMAPGQFSAWNSVTGYAGGKGGLDMNNMRASEDAYRAADAILSGQYEDVTGGATHYYNDKVATPKWGTQAGGNWGRIGNHVFGVPAGEQGVPGNAPAFAPGSAPSTAPAPATRNSAASELQRLSDLIGSDTSLTPDQVLGLIDGTQTAAITAEDQTFKREEKAVERAERARALQDERIQREALAFAQEARGRLGPDVQDAVNEIYDMEGISPQEKDARIAAVRKFYTDNASNYDLPTDVATPDGVNNNVEDITAWADYARATSPSAQVLAAANNTEDTRNPVNIIGAAQEALGENYVIDVPKAVGIINDIASEFGLDQRLVARVAEPMITEGGLFGADLKLDEAQLREKLSQTFKSGGDYQSEVELQASLTEMQTQAAKYQEKIQDIQQRRAFWEEPGRDPEKADAAMVKLDDQLDKAILSLQSLGERARTQRDEFDKARGVGGSTSTTGAETSPSAAVDSQVQRWMEEQMLSEIAAGDPSAIEAAEAALVAQGVDPRVAKNSTALRELVKNGVISLVQWADAAVGDAVALTGRVVEGAGRGGTYAYGTVDPQGASRALQLLDSFGGSMDRLAKEGFIPDRARQAPPPELRRSEGNNEAGVTYEEWRKMTRAERKRAGLPDGNLEGQFYFSRFGDGFR